MRAPLILAALSGLTSVLVGAFGAHGLSDPETKAWLQTGGQYQAVHALAVFACFALQRAGAGAPARWAAWLFLAGSALFAGSLYLLAATGERGLGAVTPVGGLMIMAGWGALAWAGARVGRGHG
jgi:uncharacterized membrane protein YgdD (TMEM256/DUF423 family)